MFRMILEVEAIRLCRVLMTKKFRSRFHWKTNNFSGGRNAPAFIKQEEKRR